MKIKKTSARGWRRILALVMTPWLAWTTFPADAETLMPAAPKRPIARPVPIVSKKNKPVIPAGTRRVLPKRPAMPIPRLAVPLSKWKRKPPIAPGARQFKSKAPKVPPPAKPPHIKRGPKKVTIVPSKFRLSNNPTDLQLSSARAFLRPLAPMHSQPVAGENPALAKALVSFKAKNDPENISDLTRFLEAFPKSRWRPAVELNLGVCRFDTGYLTDALTHWKAAWELTKGETSAPQKAVADEAVAQLVVLNARLGRKTELSQYLSQIAKRKVCAAAEDKVHAAREALSCMNKTPEIAYKCGPLALNTVLSVNAGKSVRSALMHKVQSTDKGTNLAQLKDWSDQLKLHYQLAKRTKGAPLIVPSVMHWKLGHFATIVQKDHGRYRTKDPTFGTGGNIALTAAALEAETDGYFLVPNGPLPKGWQTVTKSEAEGVWGKGLSVAREPKECPEPMQEMGGDTGGGGCGLAKASAWSMQATLNIHDTPLSYQPPIGPSMEFLVNYNYLEENTTTNPPFTNLGSNTSWTFNWLSYVTVDVSGNATLRIPRGGSEYYAYPYQPNVYSQAQLVNVSSGVYQRQLPDGSIQVYNQADGSGRIFMTEVIDPQGNSATIQFDTDFRITTVTDAIGQATTLTYGSNTFGNPGFYVVTQITDPFSRSCTFAYDSSYTNLLTITDVIGLTSQFRYAFGVSLIDAMTTPYGTTGFYTFTPTTTYSATGLQFLFPDGTTSVIINEIGYASNTYFWDREAVMRYPSDIVPDGSGNLTYSHATLTHWCLSGSGPDYTLSAAPYYVIPPLENQITYAYPGGFPEPGAPGSYIAGTSNRPSSVTRTISGATTQTWQYTYNALGHLTQSIDPIGRTFSYTYAGNDIDLTEKDQTLSSTPDINGIWSTYSQHLPGTYKDGSGIVTTYTYNSYGEIATLTDANSNVWINSYDSNGYLTQLQGPLSGGSDITTISYDGYGRVYQVTDSEGYTVTYSYDAANRVTQITYPDGSSNKTTYDKLDAVLIKDRLGRWTQRSYDSMDQSAYEVDPLSRKTLYTWCACGSLAALTDPNGNTTSWTYDIGRRVIQKTFPDGSPCYYSYDAVGRKSSRSDANGQTTSYTYNLDNSLYQVSYSGAINPTSTVAYAYDPDYLRLTSVQNGWGTISYSYYPFITSPTSTTTGAGKVSAITNSVISSSDIAYTYDVLGRVTNRSINTTSNSVTWNYDAMSRITSEVNALGTFGYSYVDDAPGYSRGTTRLSSISYPNGQVTNFNWFGNLGDQRLEGIANLKSDGTCLSQFGYAEDPAGEITAWQQQQGPNNNQVYSLQYDLAGQLTSAQSGSGGTISPQYSSQYLYSYDAASNRAGVQQNIFLSGVFGGSATPGDVVTITVTDSGLPGGQESVGYTVQSGDDLTAISSAIASAINADTNLQSISVQASNGGPNIYLYSDSTNATAFTSSTSGGATETITLGTNNSSNALTNATVVGTPAAGDVVTITVHDPALTSGQESVSYTVLSGDGLGNIAYQLANAVNGDASLSAINVSAYSLDTVVQLTSNSTNVTSYTQSASAGATENLVFSLNTNISVNGAIAGTATAGDTLTVTVYDASLSGGSESASYTVLSGDTPSSIATGLGNAIESDPYLPYFMFAFGAGSVLVLFSVSPNPTTYRATTSSGATETIVLGNNIEPTSTGAGFGATQYQYNNLNELVAVSSGGISQFQGKTNKAVKSASVATNAVNIQQTPPTQTTYGVPQYSSATETVSFSWPQNGNNFANIGGTVTTGDIVSFILYNASLPGGQEQVSYTVLSGDTLNSIATGLAAALNADTIIAALGITATATSSTVNIAQPSTTYSSSTSPGATESIVLGNNNNGNVNGELVGTSSPGDVLTLTAYNAALSGGQESANYTVLSGDTLITIAAGVAAAISADANLTAVGIKAVNSAPAVFNWSEAFSAYPLLSGYNPTNMSATDAGSNTATTEFDMFLSSPIWANPTYDNNGNITSDGTNSYLWDAENRLVEIDYPGTANYSSFGYDGLGNRVQIVETRSASVTSTKQFVFAGNQMSEERDGSSTLTKQFFSRGQISNGSATKYFYGFNHLSSVSSVTDIGGNEVTELSYDPFGRMSVLISSAFLPDFTYSGMYLHTSSGLNLAAFRGYSPSLGRWLSRDPIDEGGVIKSNLYSYVSNSPVCLTDPAGLWQISNSNNSWSPGNPIPINPFTYVENLKAWVQDFADQNQNNIPASCLAKFRDCMQHSLAAGLLSLQGLPGPAVTGLGYGNEAFEFGRAVWLVGSGNAMTWSFYTPLENAGYAAVNKYTPWLNDSCNGSGRDLENNQLGIDTAGSSGGNVQNLIQSLADECKKKYCCKTGK